MFLTEPRNQTAKALPLQLCPELESRVGEQHRQGRRLKICRTNLIMLLAARGFILPVAERMISAWSIGSGALRSGVNRSVTRPQQVGEGERGMAVGKRGVPKQRREVLKDKESRERRKEQLREAKARNATDMDRHVMQAYKVTVLALCRCRQTITFLCFEPRRSVESPYTIDIHFDAGAGSRRVQAKKLNQAKLWPITRKPSYAAHLHP